MIVILIKDVKGTGKAGDVVKVSDGYGRNMLLPRGLAKEATEGNIRSLEKQKAIAEENHRQEIEEAKKVAKKLESNQIHIKAKGGDNGRLFGSITSSDIAEALKEQTDIKVDKKKIVLAAPIKAVGETKVPVKLYKEVTAEVNVKVSI